jgi:hypothetical protein
VRRPRIGSKAPLALAGLLAVPLFFAALLAASLALDKPRMHGRTQLQPSSATEAKIWLAALIAPAALLAVGAVALFARRAGIYLVSLAAIASCIVLPSLSQDWVPRHLHRFPEGVDFIWDGASSNLSSRGEWEKAAQSTITSITHWTLALAVGAIVIGVLLELRRRSGRDAIVTEAPPVELQTGGAPPFT